MKFVKKLKLELSYNPAVPLLGIYPKEVKGLNKYLYTHIDNNIVYDSQKVETTQVPISGWADRQNVVHMYSGIVFSLKCNVLQEIVSWTTIWMNLQDIVLSEMRQSQKDKYCMIPLIWGI